MALLMGQPIEPKTLSESFHFPIEDSLLAGAVVYGQVRVIDHTDGGTIIVVFERLIKKALHLKAGKRWVKY